MGEAVKELGNEENSLCQEAAQEAHDPKANRRLDLHPIVAATDHHVGWGAFPFEVLRGCRRS